MCTRMRHIYYTLFVHMTNVFHVILSMPELSFIPIYKRSFIVFFNVYTSHLCVWSQHASQAIFLKFYHIAYCESDMFYDTSECNG